ncbi:hypothetical protein CLF_111978 [Clonorchis sinensis]|uniref:Uncharacterized protein n=1 Tax=Clonorchis sinensis TaxID=79923 RepID=G7YVL9_CLOSI|nr:hypothetical protein CLF_111978 [Clonorchis sinensis]
MSGTRYVIWIFVTHDLTPTDVKIQMRPKCVGGVVVTRSPRMSDVRGSNPGTATGYALLMSSNKSETRVQCFPLVWTHRNNYARTGGRPFKRECLPKTIHQLSHHEGWKPYIELHALVEICYSPCLEPSWFAFSKMIDQLFSNLNFMEHVPVRSGLSSAKPNGRERTILVCINTTTNINVRNKSLNVFLQKRELQTILPTNLNTRGQRWNIGSLKSGLLYEGVRAPDVLDDLSGTDEQKGRQLRSEDLLPFTSILLNMQKDDSRVEPGLDISVRAPPLECDVLETLENHKPRFEAISNADLAKNRPFSSQMLKNPDK